MCQRPAWPAAAHPGDPDHFRTILNFLRNPHTPPMPRDTAESEALVQEPHGATDQLPAEQIGSIMKYQGV